MRSWATLPLALIAGIAGAALWDVSGLSAGDDTREYLLAHPEVLPEAMQVLENRERQTRLAPLRGELQTPFPGAVLGNPEGSVTLVEFSDYACGYCRQSVPEIAALIAANPDLKVVMRELPILSQHSVEAARMALAAAQQGRYAAFHDAMFRLGPPSEQTIEAAAHAAGVDLTAARQAIEAGAFDAQLKANTQLASALGISGTPAFVIGDQAFAGAVGQRALSNAIADARNGARSS